MLLEGLKVVEMATWVAGPSAAAVLADWGAQVVKVEGPIGDATRAFALDTEESPGNPIFTSGGFTRRDWEQVVEAMINMGASIKPDEEKVIIDYLAASFPPGGKK